MYKAPLSKIQFISRQRATVSRRLMSTQEQSRPTTDGGGSNATALVAAVLVAGGGYYFYKKSKDKERLGHKAAEKVRSATDSVAGEFQNATNQGSNNERNPMVREKISSESTKSPKEKKEEAHANENVKDTSTLVGRDSDKTKKVWEDKENEDEAKRVPSKVAAASPYEDEKKGGFWNYLFGGSATKETDIPRPPVEQESKHKFDTASTAHGNPMVYEKASTERTKPSWESRMEEHAYNNVRDTSTLVGKDTEKVRGVWEDKAIRDTGGIPVAQENPSSFWSKLFGSSSSTVEDDARKAKNEVKDNANEAYNAAKNKAEYETDRLKKNVSGTVDDLNEKAYREADRLQSGWNKLKSDVKEEAQSAYDSAAETASNLSNRLKHETDRAASDLEQTQRDVKAKGAEWKQQAADRFQTEKDRASGTLNDLHKEVSANADKWKSQSEQAAKSWYEKGAEQVKSGFSNLKETADKDLQWAEDKARNGLYTAKEEVDRLLGYEKPKDSSFLGSVARGQNYAEEEEGVLRHTRHNLGRVPASVIVANAHGKNCSTASVREQYLHGYKDNERYHGAYPDRTHYCGHLRASHEGDKVVLCGWAQPTRHLSQDLIFLPIKDHTGVTQLVYRDSNQQLKSQIQSLSPESVICVEGVVRKRPEGMANSKQATGDIEVDITKLYCLNPASPSLPFWPHHPELPNEEVRLRYRYLDLRRDELQHHIRLRSLIANTVRNYLTGNGFTEIETPTLFKSTPEGAREYIVPTRKRGAFYALPQSPQQHKQMLMAAGFDRYFQIARCFRDEDLRADRQPEFTQIDLEMSFAKVKDVQGIIEGMVSDIWDRALGIKLAKDNFPHMTYTEAMSKYGSDKPDLRFDMKINQIETYAADIAQENAFDCMVVKQGSKAISGGELKTLLKELALTNSKDIAFVKVNENNISSWPAKCVTLRHSQVLRNQVNQLNASLNIQLGDLVAVHKRPTYLYGGNTTMGRVRLYLANLMQQKKLLECATEKYKFLWVESFPLFTPAEENADQQPQKEGQRKWESTHHPFTAPYDEDIPLLATSPENVRGQHYDLVLNGMEIGGGSIRIHSPVMQTFILEQVLRLQRHEYQRFDHLIDALGGGCPPHGGIALGFDRLMAILCGTPSIRDVIAFPKAAGGKDFVVNSPSEVTTAQLNEYGLQLTAVKTNE
ncbi:tRNA synthetases class II-domain-containing protein [Mycotypha africana]|uniref:tRNA synthetases class II-domain-containing protein n=1 Tax=Mycotypha africana TaxID=64632 RepID=UPI0023008461|nr:tRNA synthetases class II-domain-containing protein [Mycotypha africana]KAI8967433.1 tRNA synthetases class II-domain-containing protein [Mycotypha africana]